MAATIFFVAAILFVVAMIYGGAQLVGGVRRGMESTDEPTIVEDVARGVRAKARSFRVNAERDAR